MSYNYENENNSVNGIRITEAALGRCSVERQDTPDRHPATVTKIKMETKRGGKSKKIIRKIGTWNVRTLLPPWKLANVIKEMERVKIDILGLAEARWRNSGIIPYGDYTFLYSGNEKRSERGVRLLISKKTSKSLKGHWPISDRALCARMKGHPTDTFMKQVYAPISGSSDEEIGKFYERGNIALPKRKHREVKLVMGDWTATVGLNDKSKACGMFGLVEGNNSGEDLKNWYEPN